MKQMKAMLRNVAQPEIVILAHNIRSVYNVGSIFRTSDGAGITKIYLSGYTAHPPRPDLHKVALHAEEYVPWEKIDHFSDILPKLESENYEIIALEETKDAIDIRDFAKNLSPKICIIIGHETDGVDPEILQKYRTVALPMFGQKNSLNVASAFAAAVYFLRLS